MTCFELEENSVVDLGFDRHLGFGMVSVFEAVE